MKQSDYENIPSFFTSSWEASVAKTIQMFDKKNVLVVTAGFDGFYDMLDRGKKYVIKGYPKLPYEDESFDVVVLCYCLRNFPDPEALIDEVKRVKTRRGYVMVIDTFRPAGGLGRKLYDKFVNEDTTNWNDAQRNLLDIINARDLLYSRFGFIMPKKKAFGMGGTISCSGNAKTKTIDEPAAFDKKD